ncbi:16087_t:CDS:2 [Funneliformis caledonium]|uniref:16087_t:CDS:1 n=1 Tax=Funneliformis caledonium TaxID=1117310 RepID=A0A9N9FRH4_9GLOM|nr:16087_t:CDS:2 [Funneliformis caledonium]
MAVYKQRTCRMGLNHLRNLATVRPVRCFFDPKNDIAFKKIFGVEQNKPLLLSFLNSILRREGDNMIEEDKKDVNTLLKMQNKRLSSFIQRLEYYTSRTYSDQLFEGADYLELKPVILLAIANHNIFPKKIQCISYHHNREEESNIYFLPNLSEQLETPEDYWIHLLKEASNEYELPKEAPNEIQEAYGVLERHRWSLAEISSYEKTMMVILDDEDAIRTAKEEGKGEGREETKEEISDKWADTENQESSVNTEIPFDMTEITTDDINMEDIIITSTQSSDIAEKTIGMNKSQITTLALNLLSTNSLIRSTGIHIPDEIMHFM